MNNCQTCGSPLETQTSACPFNVAEAQAPWRADYDAMARKQMTHEEHQVIVARWIVHNEYTQSEKVFQKMRALVDSNRGRSLTLFDFGVG